MGMFASTPQGSGQKCPLMVARLIQLLIVLLVIGGSITVTSVPADAAVTAARRGDEVAIDC